MKTVVDGIYYDTAIAQLLSANCISLHGIAAEETAYCMPDGHHFIVRRSSRKIRKIFCAGSSIAESYLHSYGLNKTEDANAARNLHLVRMGALTASGCQLFYYNVIGGLAIAMAG